MESTWTATPEQERYGFSEDGFGYGWHNFDRRFDLSDPDYVNEENRFGWIVEIDPQDATLKPVKRTALGRCKHEGAAVIIGQDGRAVVYMGDDQRFDYIYKFVSSGDYRDMLGAGMSPLDDGKLYAARFNEDGTGDWLELTIDDPAIAARFSTQEEVLTYACAITSPPYSIHVPGSISDSMFSRTVRRFRLCRRSTASGRFSSSWNPRRSNSACSSGRM